MIRIDAVWLAVSPLDMRAGRPVAQGLHLLVDSTGLKMMGEGV